MAIEVDAPAQRAPMTHREVLRSLSGLLIVLFAAMVSSTVVSVSLPQIIGSLQGSQSQYTWVVTAMLLASTASTPVWGKLADLFDKKRLLIIAIAVFATASLLCGLVQNTGQLIALRAVQGVGMGALQVLVQVIIGAMVSPKERGRYNGYLGGVMAVSTVGGPLLGGAITDADWLGWRWCFFLAVPLTVIALIMLIRTLHLEETRKPETKVDFLGAILIASGVSLLLLWVTFVDTEFDWISWQSGLMAGGSLVLLAAATWTELKVSQPVVPVRVVARRDPALAVLASLAVGMAMFGGAVFLGQYFQVSRGYSPTEAGLLTIPMMFGVLVASAVTGQMVSRSGAVKRYIVTGAIVLMAGFGVLSRIDHETSLVYIGLGMLLVGTGVGMSMQNLVLVVQNSVPLRELGAASGAITFFRTLGGAVGVSILGAVLANQVADKISSGLAALGIDVGAGAGSDAATLDIASMPEPVREVVRASYGDATGHLFLISTSIAAVGVIAALCLSRVRLRETVDLVEKTEEPVSA